MADINVLVPQIPPPGLVDTSLTTRKGIDSAERLYASILRTLEKAALYSAAAQIMPMGAWCGRKTIVRGATGQIDRRLARTMYTSYALLTCCYETYVLSATPEIDATVTITTTTGGAHEDIPIFYSFQDLDDPDPAIFAQVLQVGDGDNADTGYEDLELVLVNNSGGVGTNDVILLGFDVVPLPMSVIPVPDS